MTYGLFEIPCESGGPVDIVWADPDATDRKAYTHWAYVIDTNDSENNVLDRRGIPFRPTFSRLFKTKNNIGEKKSQETAKSNFVCQ